MNKPGMNNAEAKGKRRDKKLPLKYRIKIRDQYEDINDLDNDLYENLERTKRSI